MGARFEDAGPNTGLVSGVFIFLYTVNISMVSMVSMVSISI
jgi:hypothetical protein